VGIAYSCYYVKFKPEPGGELLCGGEELGTHSQRQRWTGRQLFNCGLCCQTGRVTYC